MPVSYFCTKQFNKALQDAFLSGGVTQKRARRVKELLGSLGELEPFKSLPVTNHGETRIPHCVKYDLGGAWRLVTTQDQKTCTFIYVGDHDDVDRWLNNNKGQTIGARDGTLVRVPGVAIEEGPPRPASFGSALALLDLLDPVTADELTDGLPGTVIRALDRLSQASRADEVTVVASTISDPALRAFVEAALQSLRLGDVDGARARIDLQMGRIKPVQDLSAEEHIQVADGEEVRRLRVGSAEYEHWLAAFEKRSSWQDWFLFLHPEQARVVDADYDGPAQLSGVSGSGKTCVLVRRAMRLAQKAPRQGASGQVLIVTLNRSLAGLLRQLVDSACIEPAVRDRIEVTSFFELARELLLEFEPENARHFDDVTWKLDEHVDEVFREYYRKWANNADAQVLDPLHRSLNARGVSGEAYLRGEFDWIRSATPPESRAGYLTMERRGRRFPILEERRRDILDGLAGWERKMRHVGVVDYLGLRG